MQESNLGPPKISKLHVFIGKLYLTLSGWKVEGRLPQIPKFIIIVAPHTTNWDLPNMLAIIYALGLKANWFGKKEIFRGPANPFFSFLGGIPVDRSQRRNVVEEMVNIINTTDQLVIGLSPEGTRSKAEYWKSGFYHIAYQANIPVVFGYLDYKRKAGGIGPILYPSGDIDTDMILVQEFYKNISGKYPNEVGQIAIRPQQAN
jgi:1-acyl-sn-glycerol-3-phosphate acyltransferase